MPLAVHKMDVHITIVLDYLPVMPCNKLQVVWLEKWQKM